MDVSVGDVLQGELSATRAEVAVAVPIPLQISVYGAHHGEGTDIELPILVQQRLLDILLNDVRTLVPVNVRVLHQALDVVKVLADLNTTSSVGVLTRLHDPKVLTELGQLVEDGGLAAVLSVVEE